MALGPLIPFVRPQWLDNDGVPVAGGLLFAYLATTDTKTDTYTTSALMIANTNPVVLDSAGRATVYLDPALTYKFILSPSTDTDPPTNPIWTNDNVPGSIPLTAPSTFEVDGIGTTSTDAAIILNTTVAANNAQQYSPRVRWTGAGWNATASASRVVDGIIEAIPLQQVSGDPIIAFTLSTQVNGSGYTPRLAIRSDGAAVLGSSGKLAWSSSGLTSIDTAITRLATKVLAFDDGAGSNGVTLDFATNDTLTVRNRANNANAAIAGATLALTGASEIAMGVSASRSGGTVGAYILNSGGTSASTVSSLAIGATGAAGAALALNYLHQTDAARIQNQHAGGTLLLGTPGGDVTLDATAASVTFSNTAATIGWSAQTLITNVANAVLKLSNAAITAGVVLRFSSDAILEVRDRANAGYADLNFDNCLAAGLIEADRFATTGGGNGIDFGPAAPASITVSKGIIIAAS